MYAVAANSFFVYLLPKANIPMKTIVDVNWSLLKCIVYLVDHKVTDSYAMRYSTQIKAGRLMKKYNKLEAGIS